MTKISSLVATTRISESRKPEQSATDRAQPGTDVDSQLVRASRYAFSLSSGVRDVILDEMLFSGKEFFERIGAETTIFNEFLAKLAEAHSVRDYAKMYQECTRHQLDFARRDMERILKHGERAIDNAARLVETWSGNGDSSACGEVRSQA